MGTVEDTHRNHTREISEKTQFSEQKAWQCQDFLAGNFVVAQIRWKLSGSVSPCLISFFLFTQKMFLHHFSRLRQVSPRSHWRSRWVPEHEVCTLNHEKQLLGGTSSSCICWGKRREFVTLWKQLLWYADYCLWNWKKLIGKPFLPLASFPLPCFSQAPLTALCTLGALALKAHVSYITRRL